MTTLFLLSTTAQSADPTTVINNSWYTMQAGSTPWGYYHEVIEKKGKRYSYRSEMVKREGENMYSEVVGSLAEEDLTPVALNIAKSGVGATEIANVTYSARGTDGGGTMNVQISGGRSLNFRRNVSKGSIVDVFFPVWLAKNWDKVKPGAKGWVYAFAEDPERQDFMQKTVRYQIIGMDTSENCMKLKVELDPMRADWCINKNGQLVTLEVAGRLVRRVKDEAEAKAFLAGVTAKPKKKK